MEEMISLDTFEPFDGMTKCFLIIIFLILIADTICC